MLNFEARGQMIVVQWAHLPRMTTRPEKRLSERPILTLRLDEKLADLQHQIRAQVISEEEGEHVIEDSGHTRRYSR